MSEISIKVIVGGRTYPLTVNEQEKERVESTVAKINEAIQFLRDNYAVKDTQDLLAMAALQLLLQSHTEESAKTNPGADDILLRIHSRLTQALEQ